MRFSRFIFSCLLFCAPAAHGQTVDSTQEAFAVSQGAAVPPYVVPVLRLVSKTHVEPTTGLVLSGSGLVLVPAGFASAGDEIVVLDGGTDIVSNGRPARIERNFPMDGLQLLSVYGLKRPGAPFADSAPADGDPVSLVAFPPAEQIAEGAQPLDEAATLTVFGSSADPAVAGETPLPNVTGPLLDRCGNVVALSIANDVQTMETSPGTRYKWRSTLLGIIETLGLEPAPTACVAHEAAEQEQPPPEPEPEPEPVVIKPLGPKPEADDTEKTADEDRPEETVEKQPEVLPPLETDAATEPKNTGAETPAPVEKSGGPGGWAWLFLGAILVAAGFGLRRYRRMLARQRQAGETQGEESFFESAENEETLPDAPAADTRIVIKGSIADGRPFEAECLTPGRAVNIIIGRGTVDLRIDSAAVSRRHAALNGTIGELTITDLGSNNGTSINGVPCLEGEIMYLEPGDTVTLGDARFSVEITAAGEDE
jgi:hypothetical protein